jgi:hypothetical protein
VNLGVIELGADCRQRLAGQQRHDGESVLSGGFGEQDLRARPGVVPC